MLNERRKTIGSADGWPENTWRRVAARAAEISPTTKSRSPT